MMMVTVGHLIQQGVGRQRDVWVSRHVVHQLPDLNSSALPTGVHDCGVGVEHDVEVAHLIVARRPVVGANHNKQHERILTRASDDSKFCIHLLPNSCQKLKGSNPWLFPIKPHQSGTPPPLPPHPQTVAYCTSVFSSKSHVQTPVQNVNENQSVVLCVVYQLPVPLWTTACEFWLYEYSPKWLSDWICVWRVWIACAYSSWNDCYGWMGININLDWLWVWCCCAVKMYHCTVLRALWDWIHPKQAFSFTTANLNKV